MNQHFRRLYQFQVVRWSGKRLCGYVLSRFQRLRIVAFSAVTYWRVFSGYVLARFQRLRTFAHGNVEQPAGRDLEYIIECQVDMMSGQMQVM